MRRKVKKNLSLNIEIIFINYNLYIIKIFETGTRSVHQGMLHNHIPLTPGYE